MWKETHSKPGACKYAASVCAYLDNELEVSERRALEEHLSGCLPCQAEIEQLQFAKDAIEQLQPPVGAVQFVPQFVPISRFQPSTRKSSILQTIFAKRISLPVPVAVAFAAALLLPTVLVRTSQNPTPAVVKETVTVEVPVKHVVKETVYIKAPVVRSRRLSAAQIASRKRSKDALDGFRPAETANLRVVTK
jgi:anti-sigma factor RsiW